MSKKIEVGYVTFIGNMSPTTFIRQDINDNLENIGISNIWQQFPSYYTLTSAQ